jgi:glutamate/aspartate transport system substrate-binding protein
MKRIISTLLGAIMMIACYAATAQELGPTLKKIKDSGVITIGFRESSVPFSFYNEAGKPAGYAVDLCMRIVDSVKKELKLERLETKFTPVSGQTRIPLLVNGTIDLECGSTTNTFTRQQQVDFLYTMFVTGSSIITRNEAKIKRVSDLSGKVIGVALGTENEKTLKDRIAKDQLTNVRLVYVKDHAEGMLALETGRLDAYTTDEVVSYGLIAKAKQPKQLSVLPELLSFAPYGIMIRRDDSSFRLVANKALADVFRSGEIKSIYAKWFGPIGFPLRPDLEILFRMQAIPD